MTYQRRVLCSPAQQQQQQLFSVSSRASPCSTPPNYPDKLFQWASFLGLNTCHYAPSKKRKMVPSQYWLCDHLTPLLSLFESISTAFGKMIHPASHDTLLHLAKVADTSLSPHSKYRSKVYKCACVRSCFNPPYTYKGMWDVVVLSVAMIMMGRNCFTLTDDTNTTAGPMHD